MGKTQFCRICRTENNLKYTTKELRQLNKKQLLLAQGTQVGQSNNRASKKLLLTTPTLGNICQICDERIQIFHRLDDAGHESSSDVEIEVVKNINESMPIQFVDSVTDRNFLQRTQRPETPVIVDDDDMLFDIFMQKFDQKTQLPRHQINLSHSQRQQDKLFTNQFLTTYTPPQSTGGGSEGDESKVIEVLTSRESTPAPIRPLSVITSDSNMVDSQGHRIVAIIELDDVDENEQEKANDAERQNDLCSLVKRATSNGNVECSPPIENNNSKCLSMDKICQTNVAEDDEEIVFRKVDSEKDKLPVLRKRKRKSYDEKELRLVASLNLISSDSEPEDRPLEVQEENKPSTAVSDSTTLAMKKSFNCNVCEIKFPDFESLSVHERIHQGVKCILCAVGFQQVKRLIHHMRRKHREYSGDTLLEKPRSGQDSCMTIRLRYMQHTTFYECQLCGRIDEIFKEHKEHIIDKHPNESKSLKDPIMKQLKCPICKAKCGAQYLSLCRHLISSHEYPEYKSHLRELVHVSAFGWNPARHQEVAETARIFQFVKRKTFFFECKICCKVVAGYLHHLRHVNEHQISANNEAKRTHPRKSSSSISSKNTTNLKKLCKSQKTDIVCTSKNLRKRDASTKNFVSNTNLKDNGKQAEKVLKISKPKVNDIQKSKLKNYKSSKVKNQIENVQYKKPEAERKKLQIKNKCKPKEKEVEKLPNNLKLTKGKSKKEINKKIKKNNGLKPQVKKIKFKTPIRQIDLQKYKCKYCLKKFQGFRLYNLHLLRQHKENEYTKCNNCNKLYISSSNCEEHIKQCHEERFNSKQNRKFSKQSSSSGPLTENSQLSVKKVPNTDDDISTGFLDNNYLWLKELLKLKPPLKRNDSNLIFHESPKTALFCSQCCYCLHLFANDEDLKEHKKHFHYQNPDIFLRYKPLNRT